MHKKVIVLTAVSLNCQLSPQLRLLFWATRIHEDSLDLTDDWLCPFKLPCPQLTPGIDFRHSVFTLEPGIHWLLNMIGGSIQAHVHMLTLWEWLLQQVHVLCCHLFIPFTDSSLTHSNLAAVLETVEVGRLEVCLNVPLSVREKLEQQCDNDEERRNELISWWLQSSPYALDSWKWLSGQLLYLKKENALATAKRYVHHTPGMSACGLVLGLIS